MTKEETYEALRDQIVTISVRPGEILNEKDLMSRYGIGRSPLREVLFRLQEENLLKPLPRHGYMVTALDISEVRELVELRRELEGFAGQLAAERITDDQLRELRSIIHAAEQNNAEDHRVINVSEYYDTRFHNILYEATGNQKLMKILQDLHIVMLRIWFHVGLHAMGFSQQAQNLYVVLEALEEKDPQKARTALEAHVELYAMRVKEQFL
jgi:DNA-binding GntR family transcriptional regulator